MEDQFKATKCWLMIHNWKIQVVTYCKHPSGYYDYKEGFHEFRMWPDDNRMTLVKPDDFDGAKTRFEKWLSNLYD